MSQQPEAVYATDEVAKVNYYSFLRALYLI
jgi:hypothetical protein